MRIAAHHFLDHCPGHAQVAMAGQFRHIGNAAGLWIILERQVQGEAGDLLRVLRIGCDNQLDGNALDPAQCLQIQMHLKANGVLVNAVQQVARCDFHRTDIGKVVDHQL